MYLDSAYIAKFYLNEPDSPRVRRLITGADTLVSSMWAVAEVLCAFHRRLREGNLDQRQYRALAESFHRHIEEGVWSLVPITERLLRNLAARMSALPATTYLRAGDAAHLVTAIDAGEIEIWSSDKHLLAAAPTFGLTGRTA
jgi:predicted nucleic acid-binding protein